MGGLQSVDQRRRQLTSPKKQDRGTSVEYFNGLGVKSSDFKDYQLTSDFIARVYECKDCHFMMQQ